MLGLLLTSAIATGCTDRVDDLDDAAGSTTAEQEPDTEGEDQESGESSSEDTGEGTSEDTGEGTSEDSGGRTSEDSGEECEGPGCWIPCQPDDVPPDECWDQGPGECADSTVPPDCVEGMWECPAGWDFGGFGEGCTFPGE